MPAEIPLVQLFLFYLKTAASLRKGREVAGGAFDALGLQVEVVAEDHLVGACGLEGDVPAALRDGSCVDHQEQTRGEEEYFVHAVPFYLWQRAQFFWSFTSNPLCPLWHFPQKSPLLILLISIL
jgi:hypothetical protein